MPREVREQIASVEKFVGRADKLSDPEILGGIADYAGKAEAFRGHAVQAGVSALVYAWACGTLLNAAKEKLGYGAFGKWRRDQVVPTGLSERTSVRYMQLAARCHDITGLLQWGPTLRQAYIECGILPEPPTKEKAGADGEEFSEEEKEEEREKDVQRKKGVLLASVNELQQRLHQGISIKGRLDPSERRQLRLARIEIDKFFNQILGSKS